MSLLTNWKTTLGGIAAILGGVATIALAASSGTMDSQTITTAIGGIVGGVGLLCARDFDKSSEESGAK